MAKVYNYEFLPSEDSECKTFWEWAQLHSICKDYLSHIPNGGARNKIVGAKLKKQGVRPGFPDYFLSFPCSGYPGLFIEMKRRKGGVLSKVQQEMISNLREAGYKVVVAKGWEAAAEAVQKYLGEL